MFGYSDKVTLSGVNVINKKGQIIDLNLKFPLDEKNLDIPDDVIQMSIYEGFDGPDCFAVESFKIYVGGITSLSEICDTKKENVSMLDHDVFKNIKSVNEDLLKQSYESLVRMAIPIINDAIMSTIDEYSPSCSLYNSIYGSLLSNI